MSLRPTLDYEDNPYEVTHTHSLTSLSKSINIGNISLLDPSPKRMKRKK
jgi:hypothetical protein